MNVIKHPTDDNMNGSETPQYETSADGILLVTADHCIAERYAGWLSLKYQVRIVDSGRDALDALGDDKMVVLLGDDLQDMRPRQFLDQARKAGYEGKTVLFTHSHSNIRDSESDFDCLLQRPISKTTFLRNVDGLIRLQKYENRLDQHFALASKQAKLKTQISNGDYEARKRYTDIVDDLTALNGEIETIHSNFEPDDFDSAFIEVLP